MPKPKDKEHEKHDDGVKNKQDHKEDGIKKLSAPAKKTTMMANAEHPQYKIVTKREKQKPSETLESWFDGGLVKQVAEGSDKKEVSGARPLPNGYSGCCSGQILIEAACGVLIWPMRIDTEALGSEDKKPWTLYHFTHKASFEAFHRIFHEMYTSDPTVWKELREEVIQQLQDDYQERQPNPLPINLKGEPQLTRVEPNTFGSKEEVLSHLFGRIPTGFSKQGTAFSEFADYCIAVRAPAGACFQNTGQVSLANVRICRETLEQMTRRKAHMDSEEQIKKEKAEEEAELRKEVRKHRLKRANVGFWACFGFCGTRTQQTQEFWDEADATNTKNQKKNREMDRFKSRMAKQWLDEHLDNKTRQTAEEIKRQELEQRQRAETEKKERTERRKSNGKSKLAVLQPAPKRNTIGLDLGISRAVAGALTNVAASLNSREKLKRDPRRNKVAVDVLKSSRIYQKDLSGRASRQDDENTVSASSHMKTRRQGTVNLDTKKAPSGTRRASTRGSLDTGDSKLRASTRGSLDTPGGIRASLRSVTSKQQADAMGAIAETGQEQAKSVGSSSAAETSETSNTSASEASESKTDGESTHEDEGSVAVDQAEAIEEAENSEATNA